MNWQDFMDLLDEEIEKSIQKMVAGTKIEFEKYQGEINAYKYLKEKVKNRLKKEAKDGVAKR